MAARCHILVHYSCEMINTDEGVTFCSHNPQFMAIHLSITLLELQSTILQKIGQRSNKKITQVFYRVPIAIRNGVIRYRSWQLSSDDDVGLIFDCHAQFPEIHIIELFVALESHFNSGGSVPDPGHVGMSQPQCSPTFAMASHVQNENVLNENADDLISGPSFQQLAMQIVKPFSRDGPIVGYDFSVDDKDDEEESGEVSFDSDSGLDGVVEPITQSQPSRI